MNELVIFIQNPTFHENSWHHDLKTIMTSVICQNNFEVEIVNTSEAFFSQIDNGRYFGLYLPMVSQSTLQSATAISIIEETKKRIDLNYSGKAITLHVLEETVSLNLARFSPFFRFYAPSGNMEGVKYFSSQSLPHNHTQQSFYTAIHGLSNEILQLVLKASKITQPTKNIFIASSTPDMEPYIRTLCNFLIYNFPEMRIYNHCSSTETEKDKHIVKILKILKECILSIHVFGVTDDEQILKTPLLENRLASEFYTDSLTKYYEENIFKRLIWIPKGMDFSEKQLKMLDNLKQNTQLNAGAEIISCNLEKFKEIVSSRIKKHETGIDN